MGCGKIFTQKNDGSKIYIKNIIARITLSSQILKIGFPPNFKKENSGLDSYIMLECPYQQVEIFTAAVDRNSCDSM
jgi:hypothetical protein